MTDPRVSNLARTLVDYSIKVQPGEWVLVQSSVIALPLAQEVVRAVLRAGGNPTVWLDSEELTAITLSEANSEQLQWISPVETQLLEQINARISLRATSNTRSLSGVDLQRQRQWQLARRKLMDTFMRRSAEGSLRWTVTAYPCPAYAQEADMSLKDYEDFVFAATFADQPDPIAVWQAFYDRQERLVRWLEGKKEVVLRGPNVDLRLSIEGRRFINCAGTANMPDGEIFTGPVEDSLQGWVRFTYPAIVGGREVEGIELHFQDGRVVQARAQKNEQFLHAQLETDAGSRYVGEFAIGTNFGIQRFTKNILYDEKIGGSFHLALGAGYPETGSRNQSSIHWDMICDMRTDSEILVDGTLFYRNGEFQV